MNVKDRLNRVVLLVVGGCVAVAVTGCGARDIIGQVGGPGGAGGSQTFSLNAAPSYGISGEIPSVAYGDLNGDGKADVAIANSGSLNGRTGGGMGGSNGNTTSVGGVSILLGNGDGTFAAAVNYAAGTNPSAIALGDLDGDGKPDLVIANQKPGGLAVLLNKGDGTFGAAVNYAGPSFDAIALGDLDGDGRPDLAMASSESGKIEVLLNLGAGAFDAGPFGEGQSYAAGGHPSSVALADLDGDGKADLVVANSMAAANPQTGGSGGSQGLGSGGAGDAGASTSTGNAGVLINHGDGTFAAVVSYPTGGNPLSIAAGDMDGDGRVDLAAANDNGTVALLHNDGGGTFGAAVTYPAGATSSFVAVGDLNGDGRADVAVVNDNVGVSILLNNGSGALAAAVSYGAGDTPHSIALGDLNGDGKPDLTVAGGISVSALLNKGGGTFTAGAPYPAAASPIALVIGDLDGDGKADVATTDYGYGNPGGVRVLLNNGDGTLAAAVTYPTGAQSPSMAMGDLNGDGKADLAVVNASGVGVLLNQGDGIFAPAVSYFAPGDQPYAVAIGDLNGDAKNDLALAFRSNGSSETGQIFVFFNNGDGTFADFINVDVGAAFVDVVSVAIGDLNGDGKPDLIFADAGSQTGDVTVLPGRGHGAFAPAVSHSLNGATPVAMALGDLNGDGENDVAVADQNSSVTVFLNKGDGTLTRASYPVGGLPQSVAMGDLNGDGRAELAFASYSGGIVSVLLNNGNGTFAAALNYAAGSQPASIALGDLNSDGKIDLVAGNDLGRDVTVVFNTSH